MQIINPEWNCERGELSDFSKGQKDLILNTKALQNFPLVHCKHAWLSMYCNYFFVYKCAAKSKKFCISFIVLDSYLSLLNKPIMSRTPVNKI